MAKTISFKPKQVTKKILSDLHPRAYEIIVNRYGLTDDGEKKTLESIGKKYGITRERVRQIEKAAISLIRKSESLKKEKGVFEELKGLVSSLGAILPENDLLESLSSDKLTQNCIHLFLTLGEDFTRYKEDENFRAHWSVDSKMTERVHKSLRNIFENLTDEELVTEGELISRFLGEAEDLSDQYRNEEIAKRWLKLSKKLARNPLGEWGKAGSAGVKTRGIKDYAYLVMRKHGSPMHFREVANNITENFGKKTHVATCHNELIKDPRFVLVGRGIYALKDWGYRGGIIRDVIRDLIKKHGPMTRDEIIKKVMKERYLKKNTIVVNLQNSKYFKKDENNLYNIVD